MSDDHQDDEGNRPERLGPSDAGATPGPGAPPRIELPPPRMESRPSRGSRLRARTSRHQRRSLPEEPVYEDELDEGPGLAPLSRPGTKAQARRRGLIILGSVLVLVLLVALSGVVGKVRRGIKSLSGNDQAVTTTTRPVSTVAIPEGFRVSQILYRLHQRVPRFSISGMRELLASGRVKSDLLPPGGVAKNLLPTNGTPFEGLLAPATYEVTRQQSAAVVLNQMAAKSEQVARSLDLTAAAKKLNLTPYQVVTVASLVQAEASPSDAPKVARVLYNRMARNMPLQVDATSVYLYCANLTKGDCSDPKLDFNSSSPYNTRKNVGLPPTPIGTPGQAALSGAMHPADGPWLYYVATAPGKTLFTDNYQEFLAGTEQCRAAGLGC